MRVRKAVEGDKPWLLTELKKFADFVETKHSLWPEDPKTQDEVLTSLISQHLFFIALRDSGERVGFAAGLVTCHWFNPDVQVFSELFWWVIPERRGSSAGLILLDAVIDFCKEHVDMVFWSLSHKTEVSDRALLKRGFREQERRFLLEV